MVYGSYSESHRNFSGYSGSSSIEHWGSQRIIFRSGFLGESLFAGFKQIFSKKHTLFNLDGTTCTIIYNRHSFALFMQGLTVLTGLLGSTSSPHLSGSFCFRKTLFIFLSFAVICKLGQFRNVISLHYLSIQCDKNNQNLITLRSTPHFSEYVCYEYE